MVIFILKDSFDQDLENLNTFLNNLKIKDVENISLHTQNIILLMNFSEFLKKKYNYIYEIDFHLEI